MRVQVVYALPGLQVLRQVELAEGALLEHALTDSGLLQDFPEIDLASHHAVGISGRVRSLSTPLREGDRVEIYRPRQVDPKAKRRERLRG